MPQRLAIAFSVLALLCAPARAASDAIEMTVTSRVITHFRIGTNQERFGPLEFAGGLEMNGSSRHFGAISGLQLFDDQSRFLAVADTGFFVTGRIERDDDRHPTGLSSVVMRHMGAATKEKWKTDAEGLTVRGDIAHVSFEREHRISDYRLSGDDAPVLLRTAPPPVPMRELRANRGFETVAVAPAASPLADALVGITEMSLDANRNIMAFVRKPDGKSFQFSVRRSDEFDITDGDFLPDGDMILLERRFNISDGVAMRLRRISSGDIVEGATVDGEVLLEADLFYQIDNMEGLSITVDPDGTPRLTIVSDDNHSLLQRNLLLEFRLVGEDG